MTITNEAILDARVPSEIENFLMSLGHLVNSTSYRAQQL